MESRPIGVFDSGIGGLTVYREIKSRMPAERVIYLGDTARLPYGSKSPESIVRMSEQNAAFLMKKEVKLIVDACNSSSSHALAHLQATFDIPVVGVIEPGAQAAVREGARTIGIIGTPATISSGAYENAISAKSGEVAILSRDCPLFVPLVEEGWLDHPATRMVIAEYLLPLKTRGIDTLVLGCTHYPLLKRAIREVLGPEIRLIDSAETAADTVSAILRQKRWLNTDPGGEDLFYATDFPERFRRVAQIFLERKLRDVQLAVL